MARLQLRGRGTIGRRISNWPTHNMQSLCNAPISDLPLPNYRTVAILLCTYDGQNYLGEQLASIAAQTHSCWKIWASDDGSTDATPFILEEHLERWGEGRFAMLAGPKKGFAANFLALACNPDIQADYYAYSDQDDIWEADKLARAVSWLSTVSENTPALYCSRTQFVDQLGSSLGYSPLIRKPLGFANAIVQNVAGGNTMVFNHAARTLLCSAGAEVDIVTHDWWTYMVVCGSGGRVYYDDYPSLRYRQHGRNLVGSKSGWTNRLAHIGTIFKGRFKRWNDQNIASLHAISASLTPENRQILDEFSSARNRSLLSCLVRIRRAGIYRQTFLGNVGLIAAVVCRKI